MEIEINASEYETPAQLAHEIRAKISQLYVDWVWVNFAKSRIKITPNTVDLVCQGLMMADDLLEDQYALDEGDPRTPSFGVAFGG